MNRFFLILLVLFISPLAANSQSLKSDSEYWKETNLTIDDFINTEVAFVNADKNHFFGCIEALNVLTFFQEQDVFYAPTALKSDPKITFLGDLITTYTPQFASFVKKPFSNPNDDAATQAKSLKIQFKKYSDATRNLNPTTLGVDLKSIFLVERDHFRTHLPSDTNEAEVASEMFNNYYAANNDPHTSIIPTQKAMDLSKLSEDEIYTTGLRFRLLQNSLTVSDIIKDSSADAAEIQIGDTIQAVNGTSIDQRDAREVKQEIEAQSETPVAIEFSRNGKPIVAKLKVTKLTLPNVKKRLITENGRNVGYLKVRHFLEEGVASQLKQAVQSLKSQGAEGFILDLRNNLGGLLNEAVLTSSLFIGKKIATYTQDLIEGSEDAPFQALAGNTKAVSRKPLVVLINASSASASELVSGAFQDHQRAWIVGTRSYGKATVQKSYSFLSGKPDSIMLRKTVQRFYQPSKRTNQWVGIQPNFSVEAYPNLTEFELYVAGRGREENNYKALPPLGTPWVDPRLNEVAKINECRKKLPNLDQRYYEKQKGAKQDPDYQLMAAEDILNCIL